MPLAYPTFRVHSGPGSQRHPQALETMGSKEKIWLRNSRTGRMVMLKFARPGTGEDWSEKVAFEIARRIGVPCPRVDLARVALAEGEPRPGVLCWDFLGNFVPDAGERSFRRSLIHGNELLLKRDATYRAGTSYKVSEHTISAVCDVLASHEHKLRIDILPIASDAFSAFVGYLLLDALIGNTDRHHENWAVVSERTEGQDRTWLAPSYDHASSLGRELNDEKRRRRLDGTGRGTVAEYADRALSAFWTDSGSRRLSTLEALQTAGKMRPEALSAWLRRLASLPAELLWTTVDRVPERRLSSVGKHFTRDLLSYNRCRLLALRPT